MPRFLPCPDRSDVTYLGTGDMDKGSCPVFSAQAIATVQLTAAAGMQAVSESWVRGILSGLSITKYVRVHKGSGASARIANYVLMLLVEHQ